MPAVVTRAFNPARTGANIEETRLTPQRVGGNLLTKLFSLRFDDDPRLEAQPLYVPGLTMHDGKQHDVVFICTMANNVWAFDAGDGSAIWPQPVNLGRPVKPKPEPGWPGRTEIDLWGINIRWGILSTPVIDLDTKLLYVVTWSSPDETVAKAVHTLHALDITTGNQVHAKEIEATAEGQGVAGTQFESSGQKQRASLLLARAGGRKTLFVGFGMTHEDHNPTHGWVIAFDLEPLRLTAAWCTTPHATGCGIWQGGQGPAADDAGAVYVMTANYGEDKPPAPGDLPESFVKLHYTPPANGTNRGKMEAVAWFTPFRDVDRNRFGDDDFKDYDLGSGGPVLIPSTSLVVGAGKDGVLYVLDRDTTSFGRGSDFRVLKTPPIFFTYFPGWGIDASNVHALDHLYDGKTHHLHGSPVSWKSPTHGRMLFVWGENECLRAWKIDDAGRATFLAKSAEVASAGVAGKGGMPGGFLAVTSDGETPNTGIVWSLTPISGDANKYPVEGILRAYDTTNLDPVPNVDGTPRLKLLWDSRHIPGNRFMHAKFCPPVVADGKVFVPTYDGRVDVYGMVTLPRDAPLPTNATSRVRM